MWFVAYVHVTVVGGNVTVICDFKSTSVWPVWEHKAIGRSSAFEIVHSGGKNSPSLYPEYLTVSVVANATGNFSLLTLRNATQRFAGKYKCTGENIILTASSEAEIVVLGESIFC